MLVWGTFPRQIYLFKMHIFIQLPSVNLNTGVKSEIASFPELEHYSVHVKNRRQYRVNYRVKNYSFESKWQNFQCYGYMTSKCGNTLQNCHLLCWFSSHTESDWFILFGWILCLGKRDLCYKVATSSSPQLVQLIGDSGWQATRSRIWGLLFASQQGEESSTPFCSLYSPWYRIPAKPRELQSITHQPCTAQRLCGLRRRVASVLTPLPLPCFHRRRRKGTPRCLPLQIKPSQAFSA